MIESRLLRKPVACLAVLGVLGWTLLPPEHIHTAQTDEGRQTDIVHRHVDAHHDLASAESVDHDETHDGVRWIDSSFITPASDASVCPVNCLLDGVRWTPPAQAACGAPSGVPESVHDPPGTISPGLRGPPSLLV